MIEKRAVICVEGKLTEDGRLLEPGSVAWPDGDLPLRSETGELIGYVNGVFRVDGQIIGTLHLDSETGAIGVGADMDDVECFIGSQGDVRFTKARLRGVRLTETPCWLEARLS